MRQSAINPEQEKRKRRRELSLALAALLLLAGLSVVEYRLARSSDDVPLAGHLLLFGLLAVVILLLILVIFFLIRNLFKLLFERRGKVLGSHLKTRLTLAFVALTLVPTIVLFIASAGVLHTTIESWFTTQVEDSLQSSLVVAQAYYQNASENAVNFCLRTAVMLEAFDLTDPGAEQALRRTLEKTRSLEGISSVQVYFKDGSTPLLLKDPSLKDVPIPPPRPSLLKIAFKGDKTSTIIPVEDGGDLIRGIVPIRSRTDGTVHAALIADHHIPTSLAGRLFSISSAFGDYQESRRMKGPLKTIYILVLLMVALLVIFIGFWFGVTMARDITDPILSLAQGTEKIAAGDLGVYIEPVADDELGVLVRSFNKMTADLKRNRDELVRVNVDLESRRKYMETVLKNVAAGVLAIDSHGLVTAINNAARRFLGVSRENALYEPLMEVLPDVSAEAVAELLEELTLADSHALEKQLSLTFPDRSVSLICFANSLEDEENRDLGAVLVFEDMSQLVKAQRMAAWREVARRIAHEIKNPLTPIQLNAQRIRRKYLDSLGEDGAVLDQCTRGIIDQVEQLKNMVNEFSKFARMPAVNPLPDSLNTIVGEVVELYAQANESVVFRFQPDDALPNFPLDREQMKRAMVNLLDNALTATGTKGEVKVVTSFDPGLAIATIEVADNGKGIDPQDRDRVFEPYFSRKPGGSGLGLTIVSSIVSDHNGFVRVRANPGGGAAFVIELPVKSR